MSETVFNVGGTVSIEASLEPGRVKPHGDLSVSVLKFNYELDGVRSEFVGALDQAVTDDSWNNIFLDFDGSLNINTTGWPTTTHIRLAKVHASVGAITSIVDSRVLLAAGIDKNIHKETAEGQDSNTLADWQQKLRATLTDISEGTYVLKWYCELRHSNNEITAWAEMQVQINDITQIGYSMWPYNIYEDSSGFAVADLSAGSYTIDLDFRQQNGGTAYIRRARLMVWRIA